MKRSLLSALVLAGFAGAASAQVSLYGLLDVSFGKSIADDAAKKASDFHFGGDGDAASAGSSQGNSTSRIGIKGSSDVGSGVKANFKLETNGIKSSGDVPAPFFNRQAWVGFSGGFGEVRLGRQDSVPFQTMIAYDFNGASNGVSALGYSAVAPWDPRGGPVAPGSAVSYAGADDRRAGLRGDDVADRVGIEPATGPLGERVGDRGQGARPLDAP